jgi:hypothetical protein
MAKWHLGWGAALALMAADCLIDDDDRCGAHQQELSMIFEGCVCAPGAVPNPDGVGCRVCEAHEEAKGDACLCVDGYARARPGAPCEEEQDAGIEPDAGVSAGARGQDTPCSSSADCESFDATYCLTLLPPSVCLVPGCARGESSCAADRECCDVTGVPQLAATGGLCLAIGVCEANGLVVTP